MRKISTLFIMKLLFTIIAVMLSCIGFSQLYTSTGTVLHLNDGAIVTVNGGDVTLNNSVTGSNYGKLVLKGTSSQALHNNGHAIYGLEISNTALVNLQQSLEVNGIFSFDNGIFNLNSNHLTLSGIVSRNLGFLRSSAASNLICNNAAAMGSLFFDNTMDGTTNVLNNFTKTGAGSVTIGNNTNAAIAQLYINGLLDIQAGSIDVNQPVTGNHIVLVSDGTNLARVGNIVGALTQGSNTKIVVERSTLNKRAWRLIAAPLTGNGLGYSTAKQSVQYQWQNHQTSPENSLGQTAFGTNIYGPSGTIGMDATRPGYSMLRWNYGLQNWRNVANTTTEPMFGNGANGYSSTLDSTVLPTFLFARGDKTITSTTGSNAGRLRAVGKLLTGQQVFNYPGVGAGVKYVAIANPYASPVDFESLTAGLSSNLFNNAGNTNFYYWDPTLNNFGAFGGWITVTRNNAGVYIQNIGSGGRHLQSGTVILMQPSTTLASSATFQESYKSSTSNPNTNGLGTATTDLLVIQLKNANNAIGVLDGVVAMFGAGYTKDFNKFEDGIKLEQSNESISIKNNNLKIGVESRGYIVNTDTLFLQLDRAIVGNNYAFDFLPTNFDATVNGAKLIDKFLNTEIPLSLTTKSTVPFSITSTTGSNAVDRFMIVFTGTGNLPNKNFTIAAEKLGANKVKINWEATSETGVKDYTLEKSFDGTTFKSINVQAGKNGNFTRGYTYIDNDAKNGINFYRIKTTQTNDIEKYSKVVSINLSVQSLNQITIYPNPVKGSVVHLQLNEVKAGNYNIRLLGIDGKIMQSSSIKHNGGRASRSLNVGNIAAGTYELVLEGNGATKIIPLIKTN